MPWLIYVSISKSVSFRFRFFLFLKHAYAKHNIGWSQEMKGTDVGLPHGS